MQLACWHPLAEFACLSHAHDVHHGHGVRFHAQMHSVRSVIRSIPSGDRPSETRQKRTLTLFMRVGVLGCSAPVVDVVRSESSTRGSSSGGKLLAESRHSARHHHTPPPRVAQCAAHNRCDASRPRAPFAARSRTARVPALLRKRRSFGPALVAARHPFGSELKADQGHRHRQVCTIGGDGYCELLVDAIRDEVGRRHNEEALERAAALLRSLLVHRHNLCAHRLGGAHVLGKQLCFRVVGEGVAVQIQEHCAPLLTLDVRAAPLRRAPPLLRLWAPLQPHDALENHLSDPVRARVVRARKEPDGERRLEARARQVGVHGVQVYRRLAFLCAGDNRGRDHLERLDLQRLHAKVWALRRSEQRIPQFVRAPTHQLLQRTAAVQR
eukprot:1850980-Prymnesium_polylepis.1